MRRDIIRQLKQLRENEAFNPTPTWVDDTRAMLIDHGKQAENSTVSSGIWNRMKHAVGTFLPMRSLFVFRPLFVGAMAILLMVVGYGARVASADSLPGDTLYKVKRASETVEVALTSKEDKATKHLQLAKRRIDEVKQIKEKKQKVSKEEAEDTIQNLKENLDGARKNLAKVPKPEVVDVALSLNETKKDVETLQEDISEVVDASEEKEHNDVSSDTTGAEHEEEMKKNILDGLQDDLDAVGESLADTQVEVFENILALGDDELSPEIENIRALAQATIVDIQNEIQFVSTTAHDLAPILSEIRAEAASSTPDLGESTTETTTPEIVVEEDETVSSSATSTSDEEKQPEATSSTEQVISEPLIEGVPENYEQLVADTIARGEMAITEIQKKLDESSDTAVLKQALQQVKDVFRDLKSLRKQTDDLAEKYLQDDNEPKDTDEQAGENPQTGEQVQEGDEISSQEKKEE